MTETVDSSPEAIADMVKRLHPPDDDSAYIFTLRDFLRDAAALLAQVARERDEARAELTRPVHHLAATASRGMVRTYCGYEGFDEGGGEFTVVSLGNAGLEGTQESKRVTCKRCIAVLRARQP